MIAEEIQITGKRDIELIEMEMFDRLRSGEPEARHEMAHLFAPNVYWREIRMLKGTMVLGREHTTTHFNVVLTGKAKVWMGDSWEIVDATEEPLVFVSEAGVRKLLIIEEDMRWATIHYNPKELREGEVDDEFTVKSIVQWDYENDLKELEEIK